MHILSNSDNNTSDSPSSDDQRWIEGQLEMQNNQCTVNENSGEINMSHSGDELAGLQPDSLGVNEPLSRIFLRTLIRFFIYTFLDHTIITTDSLGENVLPMTSGKVFFENSFLY